MKTKDKNETKINGILVLMQISDARLGTIWR